MACSACAAAASAAADRIPRPNAKIYNVNEPCDYTKEILQSWLTKLLNARINNQADLIGITYPKINSYIGYVQSALNIQNYCYFKEKQNAISVIINKIDAL